MTLNFSLYNNHATYILSKDPDAAKWINCLVNSPNVVAKLQPYNGPIKRSLLLMVAASLHESFHTAIWHCRPPKATIDILMC